VVPFSAGGTADIVARALSPYLERSLGKPIVIVNRQGAGGAIGAAAVATAKPDGYTLLMALTGVSTNPEQERVNGRPAPFQLEQLTPLARITVDPMFVAVRQDSSHQSLKAVLDGARKRPAALSYASAGVYGVYHVATEMLAHAAGISLLHVPYPGGAQAMTALLSGEVDMGLVTSSVGQPFLKTGKLRPLAVMSEERWKQLPDVPTLGELGINASYTVWSGLFAPSGTAPEVLNTLDAAIRAASRDAQFVAAIERSGASLAYLDAAPFAQFWRQDSERLIQAVRRIGKIN
jgi:tripartite-type tricarboxylate transporter receptor subunit TctC